MSKDVFLYRPSSYDDGDAIDAMQLYVLQVPLLVVCFYLALHHLL